MPTTSDYLTQLQQDREDLVDNLEEKGITGLTGDETFTELVPEVLNIETGGGEPNLQTKSVTITENTTTNITADSGYDGLDSVSVTTNVPSGGDTPTKGVVFSNWNSDGYPQTAQIVGLTTIPQYYLYKQTAGGISGNLTNIILPSNITAINQSAFTNLSNLVQINLPNSLTQISDNTFEGCTQLALTELPNSVVNIFSAAFLNCTNLALTKLPDNLVTIYNYAFQNCSNLQITSLPESLTMTGATTGKTAIFQNCRKINISKVPDIWQVIPNYTFNNCSSITTMNLSTTNVNIIGTDAFSGCTSLNSINLGVTTQVYQNAFKNCTSLTDVIANNVQTLFGQSFAFCNALKKISLPNITTMNATSSTTAQFYSCADLKQVWIGNKITSANFGRYVFYNCRALEKIYIDLPRATVEAFTNYRYAFKNDASQTGIIVCNDDEGFITQQEFDELVIE